MPSKRADQRTDSSAIEPGGTPAPEQSQDDARSSAVGAPANVDIAKSAQQSIVVDCPLAEVFAFASDLAKRCRWQRGTLTGQIVDPEITELGARSTETRSASGGATEQWSLEITAFERDGLLTINAECAGGRVVERHLFTPDASSAGRTRYTLAFEATGTRWTAGDLQRQIVDQLIHFRDCVESPNTMLESARLAATRLRRNGGGSDAAPARPQENEGESTIELVR
jgi:hypothetical protein